MYEAVTAYPGGRSTVSRLARTADRYGFEGIVVKNATGAGGPSLETVRGDSDVDVVAGHEIENDDRDVVSGHVGSYRGETTVLSVRSERESIDRLVAGHDQVDVLSRSLASREPVSDGLVTTAASHGVHLEVDLRPVLTGRGGGRVRALDRLSTLVTLVDHYDAPYVVTAGPSSHLEFRTPRELAAVGAAVGVSAEWIERGLEAWGTIASNNRHVASSSFVEPGVERGDTS